MCPGVASGEVSAFTGGRISIDVGGVSDLTLSGACSRLNIDMGGVGKVDAEALKCDHVYADIWAGSEKCPFMPRKVSKRTRAV